MAGCVPRVRNVYKLEGVCRLYRVRAMSKNKERA